MSFNGSSTNGLTRNDSIVDVVKALGFNVEKSFGFGNVSTDRSLVTQGFAGTVENLDHVAAEFITNASHMTVLNGIKPGHADGIIQFWNEVYDNGYTPGMGISNATGMTKESQRNVRRRHTRVKFMARRYVVLESLTKQDAFLQELNREDVAAFDTVQQDKTWLMYEGNARIGDFSGNADNNLEGDEFDGLDQLIKQGSWEGRHEIDLMSSGWSGLDGSGHSNPADIEVAVQSLSQYLMQYPNRGNSNAMFDKLIVDQSTDLDIQRYKNFSRYQILDNSTQAIVQGSVTEGFANPYSGTGARLTGIVQDIFMPGPSTPRSITKPAQTRIRENGSNDATPCPAPTVVGTLVAGSGARWGGVWAGSYYYFVAPIGVNVSATGYEGAALPISAAIAVSGVQKPRLTITAGVGGLESGYAIFRSRRGGTNDPADARLVARIPKSSGATTVWDDENDRIPGSVSLYLVDYTNPNVLQMLDIYSPFRIGLPRDQNRVLVNPAALVCTAALKSKYYRAMGRIKNYVPTNSLDKWNPLFP